MNVSHFLLALTAMACFGCMGATHPRTASTDIPCDPEEITQSNRHSVGMNREQWTATCPAGEFICTAEATFTPTYSTSAYTPNTFREVDVSCRPSDATRERLAKEATVRADSSAAPRKMAGFTLGSPIGAAGQACRQAGHQWRYESHAATCSGPAEDVGGDASIELLFCEGKVCSIALVIPLLGERSWEPEFMRVRGALHHNYGPPTQSSRDYPAECENAFVHCSLEKRMKYRDYWGREDFRITLEVRQPPQRRAIVIRYR